MQGTTGVTPTIRRSQLNHSFRPSAQDGYVACATCNLPPSNRRHRRYLGKEGMVFILDNTIFAGPVAVEVYLAAAWQRTPDRFADYLCAHLALPSAGVR